MATLSLSPCGKPRPAVIIQSDLFPRTTRIVLLPISSTIVDSVLRYTLEPSAANGLRQTSQVMTDRITASSRDKVRQVIGALEPHQLREIAKRMSLLLDLP